MTAHPKHTKSWYILSISLDMIRSTLSIHSRTSGVSFAGSFKVSLIISFLSGTKPLVWLVVLGDEEVFNLSVHPADGYFFFRPGFFVDGKDTLPGQLTQVIFGDNFHFQSPFCKIDLISLISSAIPMPY